MNIWILDSKSDRKKRSEDAADEYFGVVDEKEKADVVVLHETDVFGSSPYSKQPQYGGKLIATFSGGIPGELSADDIESGRVLRLSFPVPRSGHISLDSWKRISNLIETTGGRHLWRKHELGPTSQENLMALSILCQGYLAAHAEKQDKEWGPPEIKPALKQMGWIELMGGEEDESELSRQLKNLSGQTGVVKDPKWWKVFDEDSLTNKCKEEWGSESSSKWSKVDTLVGRIKKGKKLEPDTVSKAYCALSERLGGEPCQ